LYETRDRIQRLSKTRFEEVPPALKVDPDLPRSVAAVVAQAMELNPTVRYQTPGEMLAELQATLARLDEADAAADGAEVAKEAPSAPTSAAPAQRTLMLVESNVKLQDIFRQRLKSNGYRVLVMADPERALGRFSDGSRAADCIIFSTSELGLGALEAFNRFAEAEHTADVPAVLLLGEDQKSGKKKAKLSERRVLVEMPIKLRQFREVLAKLVPAKKAEGKRQKAE
jgi:serine/threonine-protein kinase